MSILVDDLGFRSRQLVTAEIPQDQGVKQGCHLSPLLFNLAIGRLLCGIQVFPSQGYSLLEELKVKALAHTNDLVIAATSI